MKWRCWSGGWVYLCALHWSVDDVHVLGGRNEGRSHSSMESGALSFMETVARNEVQLEPRKHTHARAHTHTHTQTNDTNTKKLVQYFLITTSRTCLKSQNLESTSQSSNNPESKIQNSESKIQNPKSRISNPESKIENPESRIWDPESRIWDRKSRIWDPELRRK